MPRSPRSANRQRRTSRWSAWRAGRLTTGGCSPPSSRMSQADVDLIRGLYDAWLAGDREAAIQGTDPGIEWVQAPDALESEVRRGYEGVEYSMAQWTAAFDDFGFEI